MRHYLLFIIYNLLFVIYYQLLKLIVLRQKGVPRAPLFVSHSPLFVCLWLKLCKHLRVMVTARLRVKGAQAMYSIYQYQF